MSRYKITAVVAALSVTFLTAGAQPLAINKDIIPLWKAEKWDPEKLMALYKKAGVRNAPFFCVIHLKTSQSVMRMISGKYAFC